MNGIQVGRERGVSVVTVRGEVDAFNADELSTALASSGDGSIESIVIDLSSVSFLDSTALGLVVRKVNEVSDRGGGARVVLPETSARRIFEITTLDRVLPVALSHDAALQELASDGD